MQRKCVNSADNFYYICGKVTFSSQKLAVTSIIRKTYHLYFYCQVGDQGKSWDPHLCCNTCATNLRSWLSPKWRSLPFAIPMIWREQTDNISDCHFCMVLSLRQGSSKKKEWTLCYSNIPSAMRPVRHGEGPTVPERPDAVTVRDLELAKCKAELLGLRLQQWNLLDDSIRVSVFRSRQTDVAKFFKMDGNFLACNDFGGMVAALYIKHSPEEWPLFIDSTELSLKVVPLHNDNMLPSNSSWPCSQYEGDI